MFISCEFWIDFLLKICDWFLASFILFQQAKFRKSSSAKFGKGYLNKCNLNSIKCVFCYTVNNGCGNAKHICCGHEARCEWIIRTVRRYTSIFYWRGEGFSLRKPGPERPCSKLEGCFLSDPRIFEWSWAVWAMGVPCISMSGLVWKREHWWAHYQCFKAYRDEPFCERHQCFTSTLWEVWKQSVTYYHRKILLETNPRWDL